MSKIKAIDLVTAENWAITPEGLKQICAIATRSNDQTKALFKKAGHKPENTSSVEIRDDVAIVSIVGPLFRRANLFTQISGATSYEILAKDITQLIDSPEINSIVLNIDSPGGMVNGCSELASMIFEAQQTGDKKIVSYISYMGASAGYWLAASAGEIFVSQVAHVGSIGVVMTANTDKNTGEIEIVSSNAPNKRLDASTKEGRDQLLSIADDIETVFINEVAKFRGISREKVLTDFGQGGLMVGEKAVAAGMADGVGSLENVIAGLSGTNEVFTMAKEPNTGNAPDITAESIAASHPAIAERLRKEGATAIDIDKIKSDAAADETNRIKSVQAQSLAGHEALIEALMFDGVTTGEQAAIQVLTAEKAKQGTAATALKDLPKPPGAVVEPKPVAVESKTADEQWESDADLRAEFGGNKESYLAYNTAFDAGQIKQLGGAK